MKAVKNLALVFLLALFCLGVLPSCKYQIVVTPFWKRQEVNKTGKVNFIVNGQGHHIDSARQIQSCVLLDFYTNWCAPCKLMDNETFKDPKVASVLNKNFVAIKLNAEKGEGITLTETYHVKAYPTLIFINKQGKEVLRHEGFMASPNLLRYLNKTIGQVPQ